jgi:hypothetical protein
MEATVFAAKSPEYGTRRTYTIDSVHVAGGNGVVASSVFIDAIDAEEVPRFALCFSITTFGLVGVAQRNVVRSSLFEDQVSTLDIDFLEYAVVNPELFFQPNIRAIDRCVLEDSDEGSAIVSDLEFVEVPAQVIANRRHIMRNLVG